MQRDIRNTPLYQEVEACYDIVRRPGTGKISDASDLHVSPKGERAVFVGTIAGGLGGSLLTRICEVHLATGAIEVLTSGPSSDRHPRYSADGELVAFLSDRHKAGDYQLYLYERESSTVLATPCVDGWVEYLHWSSDGQRILLGVAGYGADLSSGQGAVCSHSIASELPTWMPAVENGDSHHRCRSVWVYEIASDLVQEVTPDGLNIWEAVWCGNREIAAVVSSGGGESLWYDAHLHTFSIDDCKSREVYRPNHQLGGLCASASGSKVAIVEGICSDRGLVAGDLQVIDMLSRRVQGIGTHGIDITYVEWQSERRLLLAGHQGMATIVGVFDLDSDVFREVWRSIELTTGGFYASISGLPQAGDCVLISESFNRAPEVAVLRSGQYQTVRSFDLGYAELARIIETRECVSWSARDGAQVQGWLLMPRGPGPHPLVMSIHGGPVWHWRSSWLARKAMPIIMLLKRGYAVFLPNPRGSSGRGQGFAAHVLGDMGGADAQDLLSGLDHLVERGYADPRRIGLTGFSYGGFMTAWLITQDTRFAAAVSVAPTTNHVTQHLTSNLPRFVTLFLQDHYKNAGGRYYQRSPIMHAHHARTPTLNICGALDRCAPPVEAVQFHNALIESGVKSVLVIYPEEGHGVRAFPTMIDFAARVVAWFEEHMESRQTYGQRSGMEGDGDSHAT